MPDYLGTGKQKKLRQGYADTAKGMFEGIDMSTLPEDWQAGMRGALRGDYADQRVGKAYAMGAKLLNQGPKYSQNDVELAMKGIRTANRQGLDQSQRMQQNVANAGGMIDSGVSDNQLQTITADADNQMQGQMNQANNFYNQANYLDENMKENAANALLMDLSGKKTINMANKTRALAQMGEGDKSNKWGSAISGAASGSAFGPWGALAGGTIGYLS